MTPRVLSRHPDRHTKAGVLGAEAMAQPKVQSASPQEDVSRGRRRTRSNDGLEDEDENGEAEGRGGAGSSKKRRRSRKGLDKKFECPHEGCGKSYSRAEHLYRHQLNHNPKQIYHCDFPDCQRSFVRQDLCARHKERHTARVNAAMQAQRQSMTHAKGSPPGNAGYPLQPGPPRSPVSAVTSTTTMKSEHSMPLDPNLQSPQGPGATLTRSHTDGSYYSVEKSDASSHQRSATYAGPTPPAPFSHHRLSESYGPGNSNTSQYQHSQANSQNAQSPGSFVSNQNFPPLTQLPAPGYSTLGQAHNSTGANNNFPSSAPDNGQGGMTSDTFMDGMTPTSYAIPMFGGEGYSRSPFAMADDFTAWLFNEQNFGSTTSPLGYPGQQVMTTMGNAANFSLQAPYFTHDPMVTGYFSQPVPAQHPMSVSNLIETNMQQMAISEERRQQILELIESQFNDTSHAPVMRKEELLEGNRDEDGHVLSLRMMQHYVGSFWLHFHPQMPVLHKPTFSANTCPELLLVAIMALGASCLEKTHGFEVTQRCADFAGFLAWHLRWAIFMDADFRPPAKLWVFQALLLLEIFEKMYSIRPLHERAHIHHATTLTLMRRGSSLIGRSTIDSPPNGAMSNSRTGSVNGTLSSGSNTTNQFTADEWWNQWITNEATRRAAFAAFVMDSIHATMFGHSAVMVAHEMRLPLPCDEALWSATSSAEVGRVEQSLHQNGVKPVTFLDGLKRTLNGQPVRTNSFGRTILMAGLLSVSWHMHQRDLQVSSLGVTQALGGRDKWRGSLTRAFDFWKLDLDEALTKSETSARGYGFQTSRTDGDNVFESRTVLHHLAHMAMHVDIVDCQIFAGAHRLLGRGITPQDYNGAQKRMKEGWAPTARARDATFYALRFLAQVLLGNENSQQAGLRRECSYSARDDFLLNRPWVLYFATLIVWSYGYALDGPIRPLYQLNTQNEILEDTQGFLRRVGGVRAPDDLASVKNRNACLGLLMLMRDTFKQTRWELLHEASKLLSKCIEMLSTQHDAAR